MEDETKDALAEKLGNIYQLLTSIKRATQDESIEVLTEYAIGYTESCFQVLLNDRS